MFSQVSEGAASSDPFREPFTSRRSRHSQLSHLSSDAHALERGGAGAPGNMQRKPWEEERTRTVRIAGRSSAPTFVCLAGLCEPAVILASWR